jgi:primosomal protein N'
MYVRSRSIDRFARSRPVVECAQCGEPIYVPEWSEYLESHRARHLWQCEDCGHSFETTVRFAAA